MIVTITANPSVDVSYPLDTLKIDGVNRVTDEIKTPGGKGVNVGKVLKQLGAEVAQSGFTGGVLGEFIKDGVKALGHEPRFVDIAGNTRNCVAILHDGNQTEINEKGPVITAEERDRFIGSLDEITKDCDFINISGSLPQGLDPSFYDEIIKYAKDNNKFISVDTSGKALEAIIKADIKPDLIKPNETEISDVLGKNVTKDDLQKVLLEEPFKDISYIIASMGSEGAIVKIKDKLYTAIVPKVEAVNAVGSGDSSLAGAIFAISKSMSDEDIIKTSMNCGLLNVLDPETAHISMDNFDKYYNQIQVKEL